MKTKINYILLFVFTLILFSCSDDFLDKNKDLTIIQYPYSLNLENINETRKDTLFIEGLNNSSYKIKQYPSWMELDSFEGKTGVDMLELKYKIIAKSNSYVGIVDNGEMYIEISGHGILIVSMTLNNFGTPSISVNLKSIDFGYSQKESYIEINNRGDGSLYWQVSHIPSWIKVDKTESGDINSYYYDRIKLSCDRTDMAVGEYNDSIVIKSNDKSNPQTIIYLKMFVRGTENPDNIIPVEGIVKDSRYSKTLDKLYILTQQPNALWVFDPVTKNSTQIPLSYAPKCLTLSENEKQAFIGGIAMMSIIDLTDNSIEKNINLDFSAFSIAYGENNWCYLTCETGYVHYYFSVNLTTNQVIETGSNNVYSYTNLIKVRNKPYILAARTRISPNGIILLNIADGKGKDFKYWHESFGNRFFLTENGDYSIGSSGIISKTPDETTGSSVHELGKLDKYTSFNWIDHNQTTNLFWTIPSYNYYDDYSINVYDATGFNKVRTFLSEDYATTVNGVKDFYPVQPYYIFSSKNGSKLYIIRNLKESYGTNAWSIEIK